MMIDDIEMNNNLMSAKYVNHLITEQHLLINNF